MFQCDNLHLLILVVGFFILVNEVLCSLAKYIIQERIEGWCSDRLDSRTSDTARWPTFDIYFLVSQNTTENCGMFTLFILIKTIHQGSGDEICNLDHSALCTAYKIVTETTKKVRKPLILQVCLKTVHKIPTPVFVCNNVESVTAGRQFSIKHLVKIFIEGPLKLESPTLGKMVLVDRERIVVKWK